MGSFDFLNFFTAAKNSNDEMQSLPEKFNDENVDSSFISNAGGSLVLLIIIWLVGFPLIIY